MRSPFLLLVLLLLLSGCCVAFPDPQAAALGADGMVQEERRTDKCNAIQFLEWSAGLSACFAAGDAELDELLSSFDFTRAELKRAICSSIGGKVLIYLLKWEFG